MPEEPAKESSSTATEKAKEDPIEDDDLYCLQSTFVYFQVERRIFHIPTYRLVDESQFFKGMFKIPQPDVHDVEGSSRDNPIMMPGDINRYDFRNFLKVLYPLGVSSHLTLSKDEWISVLRLATFWYFLKFRKLAISELHRSGKLSSKDKIVYGREFKIQAWLQEGCMELVKRDETISKDEAIAIDFETTFELFRIREKRLRISSFNVATAVDDVLKDELDVIQHFEIEYEEIDVDIEFESTVVETTFKQPDALKHHEAEMVVGGTDDIFGLGQPAAKTRSRRGGRY